MQDTPTAVVFGASGGIGGAAAVLLAARGHDVALHARSRLAALEPVAAAIAAHGRRARVFQADMAAPALPPDLEATVGPADVLVYAAGGATEDMVVGLDVADWDDAMAVHLRGAFLACQAFLPGMLRRRRGAIVLVGSAAGTHGSPGLAAYAAAKAGLGGLARSLAQEVGKRGVRVNVVAPGPVETAMLDAMPEAHRATLAGRTALGRLGTPADVAGAIAFLASDDARYITGVTLAVDGGLGVF